MANSVSNIDQIQVSQSAKEAIANSFFNAASNAALWGVHESASGGFMLAFYGGKMLVNGVPTATANSQLTLGANKTTYIEVNPINGAITQNLLGFTPGRMPLYIVITGADGMTSFTDCRVLPIPDDGLATLTVTGDIVLDYAQSSCRIIELSGSPSASFNLTFPARAREFFLANSTTQDCVATVGGGASVTIAAGKGAKIYTTSGKVARMTPDA